MIVRKFGFMRKNSFSYEKKKNCKIEISTFELCAERKDHEG